MNSIALFLNSGELGGAERSAILQSKLLCRSDSLYLFIPVSSSEQCSLSMLDFLKSQGIHKIVFWDSPDVLFRVSRDKVLKSFLRIVNPFHLFDIIVSLSKLRTKIDEVSPRILWANGNKVGFILSMLLYIFKIESLKNGPNLVWHFRDYPSRKKPFNFFWKFLNWQKKIDLTFVANSNSVASEIRDLMTKVSKIETWYNPSGLSPNRQLTKKFGDNIKISIPSMMAPWKGLHDIVLWASLYEKDLKNLGVESIDFFGSSIYKTDGSHLGYNRQLLGLASKFNSTFVKFHEVKSPEYIFKVSDIIIHPSIHPEPFGRVIVEGMTYGCAVLSTGKGGSAEIISEMGKFEPKDHRGLFNLIESIVLNLNFRKKFLDGQEKAYRKFLNKLEMQEEKIEKLV